jgi:hypothetical protein
MKPDWDKLMDEFKGSTSALVADVDCTAAGQPLCEKVGVRGYPSIKYGDPNDLKDYSGGRSFDDLKKFADENLGPTCGPDNLDLCDEDNKALIQKFIAMSDDDLKAAIAEAEGKISKIEAKSGKAVKELESKINGLKADVDKETKKKDDQVTKATKKSGVREMRAVSAKKKKDE